MTLLTTTFRTLARARRARAFHPRGVVLEAVWRPAGQAAEVFGPAPLSAGEHRAVVRVSHGIGLPPAAPDLVGVAVKVLDAHGSGRDQDLLFTSSGSGYVGRHLLRPTRRVDGTFSTLLPYATPGGGRHALVAVAAGAGAAESYLEVVEGVVPPTFDIRIAHPRGRLLGTVHPDAAPPRSDDQRLAFDPWHTGPALRPTGWINRLRRPTYGASRAGRPR